MYESDQIRLQDFIDSSSEISQLLSYAIYFKIGYLVSICNLLDKLTFIIFFSIKQFYNILQN